MFIWSSDDTGLERIDVIENKDTYDVMNTTSCLAAYYKNKKDYYWGEIDFIQRLLLAQKEMTLLKQQMKQTCKIVNGKIMIWLSVKESQLGIDYQIIMENGILIEEIFITPDIEIYIYGINKSREKFIPPINLNDYVKNKEYNFLQLESNRNHYYSLEHIRENHVLDHIESKDFIVVEKLEEGIKRLQEWTIATTKVKAIHIETTGPNCHMSGKDCIVGITLSYSETNSTYYPFRQENFEYNLPISFIQTILDAIHKQKKDIKIISHHGEHTIKGFWKEDRDYITYSSYAKKWSNPYDYYGLNQPNITIHADTFILSLLFHSSQKEEYHSLENLSYQIDGFRYLRLKDIFKNKNQTKIHKLPKDIVTYYACPIPANAIKVYYFLIDKLAKEKKDSFQLECLYRNILAEKEFYDGKEEREVKEKDYKEKERDLQSNKSGFFLSKELERHWIWSIRNVTQEDFTIDAIKQIELKLNHYRKQMRWEEKVDCNNMMLPKVRILLSKKGEILISSHKSILTKEITKMIESCTK